MLASPERTSAYIVLEDQVSARKALDELGAKAPTTLAARGTFTINTLRARHEELQAPIIDRLRALPGVANVRGRWLANLIGFEASAKTIREVADWPEVAGVYLDAPWEFEQVVATAAAVSEPDGREVGHSVIRAPEMWALGYTGYGGVAFTADTGVDPFHPALNHKYAGLTLGTPSWYDFQDGVPLPADCDDHGTHVNGTVLGLDRSTNDTIGVAFNAHWFGGAILCGFGTVDNIGAFEWALDPDGDLSTSEDRPFVINNSWRDPSITDIECQNSNPYPRVLDNLFAAGVSVVFSAGNSGPDSLTITPPHNYNAGLVNAFTVGALDGARGGLPIADFSSRGPALCTRDSLPLDIKPEVSAPGVRVRSCIPGGGYANFSGTSMAAPHTSGAILLLHEAFPNLTGEDLQLALYFSARDLGTPGEDNTFGRGVIDVMAAYEYLVDQGHDPVPPRRPETAIAMTAIDAADAQCGGQLLADITVLNEGTTDITELGYVVLADADTIGRGVVSVDLPAGATVSEQIEVATDLLGDHRLALVVTEADGAPLERALDLGGTFEVEFSDDQPATLTVEAETGELCIGSVVDLRFTSDTNDDPILSYFNIGSQAGRVPLDAEPTFTTPVLTEETTFVGVPEYQVSGGPDVPDEDRRTVLDPLGSEMVVSVSRPTHIRTFDIVAAEAGRIIVQIFDDEDVLVGRESTTVQEGLNTLEIDAFLEPGPLYTISFRRSVDLAIDLNARVRGSRLGDLVRVFTVSDPDNSAIRNSSYFLFNFQLGYIDGCVAQSVTLVPDADRTATELAVQVVGEPRVGESFTLAETALDGANRAYDWVVDDEPQADRSGSIVVTPTAPGELRAKVSTIDDANCATGASLTVEVEEASLSAETPLISDAQLFPNPAQLKVSLTGGIEYAVEYAELRSVTGVLVRRYRGDRRDFDLAGVAAGNYVLSAFGREGLLAQEQLVVAD